MITPKFRLSQTESHLIVVLHVPHIRVSSDSLEVVTTDDSVVHISAPPYLLKLSFGPDRAFAEGADEACATYDPQGGEDDGEGALTVQLPKLHKEIWDDLHLLGKFVVPTSSSVPPSLQPNNANHRWLQEIVAKSESHGGSSAPPPFQSASDDPPTHPSVETSSADDRPTANTLLPSTSSRRCGFARLFPNPFEGWSHEACDQLAPERGEGVRHWAGECAGFRRRQRRRLRRRLERTDFSAERYVQDLDVEDDYVYQCFREHVPHWRSGGGVSREKVDSDAFFSSEERLQLATIPYPLLPPDICDLSTPATLTASHALLLGLVDVLFAYVYDHLTTQGESTVESAWTLSALSATLSWMEDWLPDDDDDGDDDDEEEDEEDDEPRGVISNVVKSSLRRALIYPYLRNLGLAVDCAREVAAILRQGTAVLLRCLLHVRFILHKSDAYYLSNKLYVDPYLAWIQHASPSAALELVCQDLGERLLACLDDAPKWRTRLDLDLVEMEAAALDDESSTSTSEDSSSAEVEEDEDSEDHDDDNNDDTSGSDDDDSMDRTFECPQAARPLQSHGKCDRPLPLQDEDSKHSFQTTLLMTSRLGALSLDGGTAIDQPHTQVATQRRPLIQELD